MKKYIAFMLTCLLLITNTYALAPNGYTNASSPNGTSSSKIINYFENKRKDAVGDVFCIGIDEISYFESFLDEERDYYNLPFSQHLTPNSALANSQKQINPINLKIKYEHNPQYYHNPTPTSSLSGTWYDIAVRWNSDKEKWEIVDPSKSILFNTLTDDKRGEWTISLKGTDSTGKPIFDKESMGSAKFRVHKAPIPRFTFTENINTATLIDNGSYDVDWQYKANNGIKEYYWSAKIGGNWVDVGKGKNVTFNKNGQQVTDYMLTVEDLDGAFASISKNALILDKPVADFEFRLGTVSGRSTQDVYRGNVSHEKLYVAPTIAWNDDVYDPNIYGNTVTGRRTEKWVSLNTLEERIDHLSFSNQVLINRLNENVKNNLVKVLLEVKNKYDLVDSTNKSVSVKNIELQDLTSTGYVHVNCGFEVGKTATIKIKIKDLNHLQDLNYKVDIPELGLSNVQLQPTANDKRVLTATIQLDARNSFWQPKSYEFDYSIKVYSKRTETTKVLHQVPGKALIHTPLDLVPYINDLQENIVINADENFIVSATTREYAEKVTVRLPVTTIDPSTKQTFAPDTPIPLDAKNNNTKWNRTLVVDTASLTEEQIVSARYDAYSFNKRDTDTKYLNLKVIAYRLIDFRVVQVRDLALENFYKDYTGKYQDKKMFVNDMAIDAMSFQPYPISYLTKGYVFEFEIDSINFNSDSDTIVIQPGFYSIVGSSRDPQPKEAYWIDSNKKVLKVGTGGHSNYAKIILTKKDRTIVDKNKATWRGQYYIPGTTFLTNPGNTLNTAKNNNVKSDIIVNFNINGLKNGTPKVNYNNKQWGIERTIEKFPYAIGDVIRYKGDSSNLNDLQVNRTQ